MKTTTFAFLATSLTLAICFAPTFTSTSQAANVTFDWATIGNPGNAGELSGWGAGGYGPNVIVGAVDYNFRISKTEVTAGQYTEFLNAVAATDPNGLYNPSMSSSTYGSKIERTGSSGTYIYSVTADRKNRPVNFVSYFDAMRFTNWLENGQPIGAQGLDTTEDGVYAIGNRPSEARRNSNATYFIPSEDEWYKAAYHKNDGVTGNYWDYPTGSDSVPSNDLMDPDPGNNANFNQSSFTIGSPYWMTEVGEFENSESPYGTFDQGGNVHEWNEAVLYSVSRGVRGGGWVYVGDLLAASHHGHILPTSEYRTIGFRVASIIPEPSTILLGALASMGLLMRRRRLS